MCCVTDRNAMEQCFEWGVTAALLKCIVIAVDKLDNAIAANGKLREKLGSAYKGVVIDQNHEDVHEGNVDFFVLPYLALACLRHHVAHIVNTGKAIFFRKLKTSGLLHLAHTFSFQQLGLSPIQPFAKRRLRMVAKKLLEEIDDDALRHVARAAAVIYLPENVCRYL